MSDESVESRDVVSEAPAEAAPAIADEVLLAAAEAARTALYEITSPASVGRPAGHIVEGERVLSLLFENRLPGYPGWYWTVSLSREPDSSEVNVLEAELMPGDGALLAPEWVPWADRLAEYQAQKKAERDAAAAAGEPQPDDDFELDDDESDDSDGELDDGDLDDDLDDDAADDDFEDDVDDIDDDDLEVPDVDDFDEAAELQGVEEAALASDDD